MGLYGTHNATSASYTGVIYGSHIMRDQHILMCARIVLCILNYNHRIIMEYYTGTENTIGKKTFGSDQIIQIIRHSFFYIKYGFLEADSL